MIGIEKLETRRLKLCPFMEDNFKNFFDTINNKYCMNYINRTSEGSVLEKAKTLFSSIIGSYNTPNAHLILKILKKETNEYIGACGLMKSNMNEAIECFYTLLPFHQGNGYTIEAMLKLFEFSFNILNIPKIIVFLHPDNSKGWKVAERIGMKYLGHYMHSYLSFKVMLFSIEKQEYVSQRRF
ncbi:MAG: GNAT family N-acetyltransferase [Promethearchaeota archaeon]